MVERSCTRAALAKGRCIAAAAVALIALACAGSGEATGPCYVEYEEPLFTISAASDSRTGTSLSRVYLKSFSYDGRTDLGLDFLTNHLGLHPRNVAIEDGELSCDVDCAFGGPAGNYTFTFRAIGYRDTTFSIQDANFAHGVGNCPAVLSGGLDLKLTLTRE